MMPLNMVTVPSSSIYETGHPDNLPIVRLCTLAPCLVRPLDQVVAAQIEFESKI
jgi:hypothetical protein